MFCDKKKCDKCGLAVDITLQNKETNEIKQVTGCVMMELFRLGQSIDQDLKDLRKDTQVRGNEIVKGIGHQVMTNLKRMPH